MVWLHLFNLISIIQFNFVILQVRLWHPWCKKWLDIGLDLTELATRFELTCTRQNDLELAWHLDQMAFWPEVYENIHLSKDISIGLKSSADAGEVKYPLIESEHTHLSSVTNIFLLLFQRQAVPCLLACPLNWQCTYWTIYSTHLLKSHNGRRLNWQKYAL